MSVPFASPAVLVDRINNSALGGPAQPERIEMQEIVNADGSKTIIKRTTRIVQTMEADEADTDIRAKLTKLGQRMAASETGKPAPELLDLLPPRPYKLYVPEAEAVAATDDDADTLLKPGERNINLDPVYNYMMWRRFERARTGTRRPPSWTNWLWAALILALFLVWVGFLGGAFSVQTPWLNALWLFLILPLALFLSITITAIIKAALVLLVAGLIILAFVYAAFPPTITENGAISSPQYQTALQIIVIIEIVAISIAMLMHLFYYVIYPWLVKHQWVNLQNNYTPLPGKKGVWKYRAWEPQLWKITTNIISYSGQVDEEMRPHGLGTWRDDGHTGEVLSGLFEHGKPIGPYVCREYGTGNAFSCVLIGYARNGVGGWSGRPWFPSREFPEGGLRWGYARVECSVSGKFFSKFPDPQMAMEATFDGDDPQAAEKVIAGLSVGEDPRSVDVTNEALIFIHGYNASIESTCVTLGQLVAMIDLPRYIKPFIFSWPSANSLTYLPARKMITSPECLDDFVQMIRVLGEQGFGKIHIIGHSMGSRLATKISSRMSEIFEPLSNAPSAAGKPPAIGATGLPLPKLISLTLLNAEAPLHEFVEIDYPVIRDYCELISVYNDEKDGPLELANVTSKIFKPDDPTGKGYKPLGRYARECYVNDPSGAMVMAKHGKSRPKRLYPDIDIISTTSLDANIQGMRHTFFSSNRMLTDDLFDIIVYRRRAAQRDARLVKLDGVMYSYMSPPAFFKF